MPDNSSGKPLPAWQQPARPAESTTSEHDNAEAGDQDAQTHPAADSKEPMPDGLKEVPVETKLEDEAETKRWDEMDKDRQLEHMKAFLEDPTVQQASDEKKRSFFENKGIPTELVDQLLGEPKRSHQTPTSADFAAFQRQDKQARSAVVNMTPPAERDQATPIITYPEFLVEAHKRPPIVTFNRLVNVAYVAGSVALLTHAANRYLLQPMIASLSDARHELADHTQGKLDELNERLAKIASKMPESEKAIADEAELDDSASVDSDPTELFHRDVGTQTVDFSTAENNSRSPPDAKAIPVSVTEKQEDRVKKMHSHLADMADGVESGVNGYEEVRARMTELRVSIDLMLYSSHGMGSWSQNDESWKKKTDESMDALSKEIRGVKSTLLSARRFPGPTSYGRVGAT